MAMSYEKASVLVRVGLEEIYASVFGHELSILALVHGGTEKLRLLSRGPMQEIDSGAAEYERLARAYGSDQNDVLWVDRAFAGGPLAFDAVLATSGAIIDGLERQTAAESSSPEGVRVQPSKGEDGYLNIQEIVEAYHAITGETLKAKGSRRATLRSALVVAVEDALLSASLPVPDLETDPEITAAVRTYTDWKAAQG